ncbi:MAG: D-aminoacyl-tRNA deacylase [Planctomycetota bacterium]
MITIVQRVLHASVQVDGRDIAAIGRGLMLLVGVERGDTENCARTTALKLSKLRCFPGRTPMDATCAEIGGGCLVISQFTLAAELADGNRPSFSAAEDPTLAEALYLQVAESLREQGLEVSTGVFGAKMAVTLCNDGPVTFALTVRGGKVQRRPTT